MCITGCELFYDPEPRKHELALNDAGIVIDSGRNMTIENRRVDYGEELPIFHAFGAEGADDRFALEPILSIC